MDGSAKNCLVSDECDYLKTVCVNKMSNVTELCVFIVSMISSSGSAVVNRCISYHFV